MKDKIDKDLNKYTGDNWKNVDEDDDSYENFKQIKNKKSSKFKDESKDIYRGRKLNKRTYR